MILLRSVKRRIHTHCRLPSRLPLVEPAPRLFAAARIRPQHILGEPAGIDALCEKTGRNVFGNDENWKWAMLAALEDLLRSNCVREACEAGCLLIRERKILRQRKNRNLTRMSRRELLRQPCIVHAEGGSCELPLKSQRPAPRRFQRRRECLTHRI